MYCNIERPAGLNSPVLLGSLNAACAPCFIVTDQTGVVGFYVYFSKGKPKKIAGFCNFKNLILPVVSFVSCFGHSRLSEF